MKIDYTKTGGIMSWGEEDWLGGLLPWFQNVDYSVSNNGQNGVTWNSGVDPYYIPGTLYPSTLLTSVTNASVVSGILKNAVTDGDQAYAVGGAKVQNFGALTGTLTNGATFPFTLGTQAGNHNGHSNIVLEDIAIYYVGSTKYAFYSFNDGTDADIGTYNLSSTFDDDWMKTQPASGANFLLSNTSPHPMVVGDDDCLYIGDGRDLDKFDGQTGGNGTFTRQKLSLPLGSIITSFSKIENYLVIYAYKPSLGTYYNKSEVRAYFWDYVSEDPTYVKPIQGNYINGGFTFKGQPGCFVQGVDPSFKSQRGGKLVLFNGSQFDVVATFPESIPGHGGVETIGNAIRWNSDGVIYQWGSLFNYLNAINRLLVGNGTTSGGMLRNLALNYWFASSGTTTSGGLDSTVNGGFYSGATVTSGQTQPNFPIGYRGRLTKVKAFWRYKNSASGHRAKIQLLWNPDYSGSFNANMMLCDFSAQTSLKMCDEFTYGYSSSSTANVAFPIFAQLAWKLSYTAGATATDTPDVLQRLEFHYENIKD